MSVHIRPARYADRVTLFDAGLREGLFSESPFFDPRR
jgi:hypothetical protein